MSSQRQSTKQLVIITEHFSPSTGATAQLATDLAEYLHSEGHKIAVLTSTPTDLRRDYAVVRLAPTLTTKIQATSKTLHGLTFFVHCILWLFRNIHSNDSLLIFSNPPFIGLIGLLFSLFKRIKYVFVMQDIFPRSAVLSGFLPVQGPLVAFWKSLTRAVITNSSETIVLNSDMIRRCRLDFGGSGTISVINNWSVMTDLPPPHEQNPLVDEWNLNNYFVVQYSGNFGRLHDILTILEVARLKLDKPIKFLFIGDGAKKQQINAYKNAFNLTNVLVKPYQPLKSLHLSLGVADISVVSLMPGSEDTIAPSKLYGILASSKPVLLLCNPNSGISTLLQKKQCAVVVEPGDVSSLSRAIDALFANPTNVTSMSRNAYRLHKACFNRLQSLSSYSNVLRQHGMI